VILNKEAVRTFVHSSRSKQNCAMKMNPLKC